MLPRVLLPDAMARCLAGKLAALAVPNHENENLAPVTRIRFPFSDGISGVVFSIVRVFPAFLPMQSLSRHAEVLVVLIGKYEKADGASGCVNSASTITLS